jgi:hypothetical protein
MLIPAALIPNPVSTHCMLFQKRAVMSKLRYQTLQRFSRTMGLPALQANAFWNSGMLDTTPLVRYLGGEWGSTVARRRRTSGRSALHQLCP